VYLAAAWYGIKDKSVHVSWKSVMVNGEYWRLMAAHLFHFTKVNLFVNCISLMTLGEKLYNLLEMKLI
jgi:membrane associated rhomboid family serine protease